MNFAAFFSYIFITAFTPGPNNLMSMTNAGKYGFRKSFPFNLGVLFGFLILMSGTAVFSSVLFDFIPAIEPYMRWVGAAYTLWLAWIVWRDKADKEEKGKKGLTQTNTIISGMVLQFVNVKVMLYGITAMSSFVLPYYRGGISVSVFVVILSMTGFLGTCCWALFGAAFERFFEKYRKVVNVVMALLLMYCAAAMVLDI